MDKKKITNFIEEHLFSKDHYTAGPYNEILKSLAHLQGDGEFCFDPEEVEFIRNFVQYFTVKERGHYPVTIIKMLHLSKETMIINIGMENFRTLNEMKEFVKYCTVFDINVSLCEIYGSVAIQLKIRR